MLDTFRPTLVMLDIEMPGMNGFDFLNKAGSWDFDVIFTTAFDQYAIKAIRFSALDYLLKPLDIVELQNALNRHIIRRNLSQQSRKDLVHNLIENVQRPDADEYRLALSTTEGVFFYLPSEIIRCEGESNYTTFYLEHAKPLIVSHTFSEYEICVTHGSRWIPLAAEWGECTGVAEEEGGGDEDIEERWIISVLNSV